MSETGPDEDREEAKKARRAAQFLHRKVVFILLGCLAAALLLAVLSGFNPDMRTTVAFILALTIFLLFFSFALYVAKGKVHFRKRDETGNRGGDM